MYPIRHGSSKLKRHLDIFIQTQDKCKTDEASSNQLCTRVNAQWARSKCGIEILSSLYYNVTIVTSLAAQLCLHNY